MAKTKVKTENEPTELELRILAMKLAVTGSKGTLLNTLLKRVDGIYNFFKGKQQTVDNTI